MEIVCNRDTKRKELVKLIRHIMVDENIKNINIVRATGQTEQSVSNLLNPNYRSESSMTIDQFAVLCNAVGYDLVLDIRKKDRVDDVEFTP